MASLKQGWQDYKDTCLICPWGVARIGSAVKQHRNEGKKLAVNAFLAFPAFSWLRYPRIAARTYKWGKKIAKAAKRK